MILAIDPGNVKSAYVFIKEHSLVPSHFGIVENSDLLKIIYKTYELEHVAIEMIASYGMSVGQEIFDTCVWGGRFHEALRMSNAQNITYIYRKDEKMNLCGSMRAKDSNIRQALIDRFGVVGTKGRPGWFYGFKKDLWQSYAVGVTYHDIYLKGV